MGVLIVNGFQSKLNLIITLRRQLGILRTLTQMTLSFQVTQNLFSRWYMAGKRNLVENKNGRKKKSGRMGQRFLLENTSDNSTISEKTCLEYNNTYHFSIFDSFGDGICCVEGEGSYAISVDNVNIKEGGNFALSEEFSFRFLNCTTDQDCDDGDISTDDFCSPKANTCLYYSRPCDEYGAMVFVNLTTDRHPADTSWKIVGEDGSIQLEGGPYMQSFFDFHYKKCLAEGTYEFILSCYGNKVTRRLIFDDILFPDDTLFPDSSYIVYTETAIIKEYTDPLNSQNATFTITVPSSSPSISSTSSFKPTSEAPTENASNEPTSKPSGMPSNKPSNKPSSKSPSYLPSASPSLSPTISPTSYPTTSPINIPTISPFNLPSIAPVSTPAPIICRVLNGRKCKKHNKKCNWEKVTKSCYGKDELPACTVATAKRKCNKLKKINSNCFWSYKSKTCGNCSHYTGSWRLCNKEKANCKWEDITKTCFGKNELPPCSSLTVKWKCKSKNYNGHCTWSKSEGACKDR